MSAKIFVDTNIWLYSLIQTANDPRHTQAVDFLLGLARPVISSQVIGEICSNLLKKTRLTIVNPFKSG
jgi:predicted nucleic acid-binding protein